MEGEAVERDTRDAAHGAAGASIESLRETYVEYETQEDSSTSCPIIEQGRFFYVHRICSFEQGLYEAKKAINMPTGLLYSKPPSAKSPHENILLSQTSSPTPPQIPLRPISCMQQVTYVIGCFATPESDRKLGLPAVC